MQLGNLLTLRDLLTDAWLKTTAPDRYYLRGLGYFYESRVYDLWSGDFETTAKIRGSRIYTARITVRQGALDCFCSCPLDDDALCKHLVALGLEWLDDRRVAAGGESQRDQFQRDMRLRAAIAKLSPSSMSGLIHEYAQENDDFMAFLHAELSRRGLLPPR